MTVSRIEREMLQKMLDMRGDGGKLCPRCGCCELVEEECWNCGGSGFSGHDCGEDCCVCLDPQDNIPCEICGGRGYSEVCLGGCGKDGKHRSAADIEKEEAGK